MMTRRTEKMRLTVNVPATTANLGPGFDCLGLALEWWNTITVEAAKALEVRLRGLDEGLPADASNVTLRAMRAVFEQARMPFPSLRVTMTNRIPIGRGLGSSAAAIVGGVVAANAWLGNALSPDELLALATGVEGHPDNVSAALLGGLTIVVADGTRWIAANIPPPPDWRAVVFVPAQALSTKFARQILPKKITRADAVFNIGRAALIVHAFAARDARLLALAMQDRLHQPYRAQVVPGMNELLQAALDAGALGAALSGAGPSIIALVARNATRVARAMARCAQENQIAGTTRLVRLQAKGAQVVWAK